jgi:hypothetical protein
MRRSGQADLPLHGGRVPDWLKDRMVPLGTAIVESVAWHYGRREVLTRLSDPYWFQAFGCVLGMDWHSSGITTSVLSALKRGINPIANELGLYVCGGRGAQSRRTPDELLRVADANSLDGNALVRCSRLAAKVDNTAVQDGFQLYLHSFIVSRDGDWTVVQQGMNPDARLARRYHWLSTNLRSFVEEPHTAVVGRNQGLILNLTHPDADPTRNALVGMTREFGQTEGHSVSRPLRATGGGVGTSTRLQRLSCPRTRHLAHAWRKNGRRAGHWLRQEDGPPGVTNS